MLCCYWGQVLSGSLLGRGGYKSSWPFDYLIFSLPFLQLNASFYLKSILQLLLIHKTPQNWLYIKPLSHSLFWQINPFFCDICLSTLLIFNDIFHQILCSLHASAPSGNWMSNLRNETKILHLPKAQRNQALAAFVNLNRLNENHFDSGLSKMYLIYI